MSQEKTKKLVFELRPDILQVHSFCAYPGTDIYAATCKELPEQDLANMHHHGNFKFCKEPLAAKEMEKEILRDFFLRIPYVYKSILKFWPYYIFNPGKTLSLLKAIPKIAYRSTFKSI